MDGVRGGVAVGTRTLMDVSTIRVGGWHAMRKMVVGGKRNRKNRN